MYALYLWAYASHGAYVIRGPSERVSFLLPLCWSWESKVMRLDKRHPNTADHLVYSQD